MELKLRIRQHFEIDPINGQKFYYSGTNPATLTKQFFPLPAYRQWTSYNGLPVANYIDITGDVSDLHKLSLIFTSDRDNTGQPITGGEFAKKSSSGTLTIEGEAYQLIKKWLITDVSAPLNIVDVQIEHVGCGVYDDFVIKPTDLEICDNDICQFVVTLKQKDDALNCIQNTLITDNWQGWFPDNGRPINKKHPRFSYCNEVKPNGILISIWYIIFSLSGVMFLFLLAFIPLYNTLIVPTFNIIGGAIAAVVNFINNLGGNINFNFTPLQPLTFGSVKDIFGQFFVESAGCGREHPAPLIRDYISNVCSKCGVTVNGDTAQLFFSQSYKIETSVDRDKKLTVIEKENPYFNACYGHFPKSRGVRRFESLVFSGSVANNTDYWIQGNAPFKTLDMLLDELKPAFNMDWRIDNNTLYIKRKDFWTETNYQFDFTAADKNLIIQGACWNWTGKPTPAIIKGLYAADGSDTCGNEAQAQYDGIVGVGNTNINPLFKGILDKTTQFGAAKFRLDGASEDYIVNAMQQLCNTQFISTAPWTPLTLRDLYRNYFKPYADYALLLKQETAILPKILIWDGGSYENARCVKTLSASYLGGATPIPNTRYNNYPITTIWEFKHPPQTKTLGSSLSLGSFPISHYSVRMLTGQNVMSEPAMLVNYPMYFEPAFEGTLWDKFHWIDDPILNPSQNREWVLRMELCKDTLKRVKPFLNGKDIILGQRVKLYSSGTPVDGKITEITINYDTSDILGMYIELKGIA